MKTDLPSDPEGPAFINALLADIEWTVVVMRFLAVLAICFFGPLVGLGAPDVYKIHHF